MIKTSESKLSVAMKLVPTIIIFVDSNNSWLDEINTVT